MKFGCFGFTKDIDDIAAIGFSNAELDLLELIKMTDEEFLSVVKTAERSGLDFDVFSGLFPLELRFHSPGFDRDYWMNHVKLAVKRATALGGKMIPLGAGKCRSIPEGCADVGAAKGRIRDLVCDICDEFAKADLKLVVEPLGPKNSNFLNTVAETVEFISSIHKDNCRVMCDMRHMYHNNESFEDIVTFSEYILHAHIDYPIGNRRFFPKKCDGYDYTDYINALNKAGYNGILTIEATDYTDFFSEAREGLEVLKHYARALSAEI